MKLEDMIMVVENREGTENNRLLDLTDYMEAALKLWGDYAEDMAGAIGTLYDTRTGKREWSDLYFTADQNIRAAFCTGEPQLKGFLAGNFNDGVWSFDEGRSSESCMALLRAYGMGTDGHSLPGSMRYEPVAHDFQKGEVLRNLNGRNYRVLSVLSPKNLLLIGQADNQLVVAKNIQFFARYPKGEQPDDANTLHGVEWGHGIYLGDDITRLDFDILLQEHGEPGRAGDIQESRDQVRRTFWAHKNVEQKESLAARVKTAAREGMEEIYRTSDPDVFRVMLDKGVYDGMYRENGRGKKPDRFSR